MSLRIKMTFCQKNKQRKSPVFCQKTRVYYKFWGQNTTWYLGTVLWLIDRNSCIFQFQNWIFYVFNSKRWNTLLYDYYDCLKVTGLKAFKPALQLSSNHNNYSEVLNSNHIIVNQNENLKAKYFCRM